jgi:hypothetical protein
MTLAQEVPGGPTCGGITAWLVCSLHPSGRATHISPSPHQLWQVMIAGGRSAPTESDPESFFQSRWLIQADGTGGTPRARFVRPSISICLRAHRLESAGWVECSRCWRTRLAPRWCWCTAHRHPALASTRLPRGHTPTQTLTLRARGA